jgi:PmbA protein
MLGEQDAKKICHKILGLLGKGAGEVILRFNDGYLTRFANNYIHQNVAQRNTQLTIKAHLGTRVGIAVTNRLDGQALEGVVARAKTNAKASPENPYYPGLPEPSKYNPAQSFDEFTAASSPDDRATAVGEVCSQASDKGFKAFGALTTGTNEVIVGNTDGLFAYHVGTKASFSTVIMEKSGDASGWAEQASWRYKDIPIKELGAFASRKVEMGHNPKTIELGEYPVVLDPSATVDFLMSLNSQGMGANTFQEGRSWMVGRIGKQAFSPSVNIWDDGLDPNGIPMSFDYEGVPKHRVDIVKDGVIMGPVYDHRTAHKDGVKSTGHCLPPDTYMSRFSPMASNLFMAPGDSSVDEMIASIERGIYITRFWYTRVVHPSDCVVTGMTRDGAFLVEDGEIAYPVKNLRFTQSYVNALANVEALSKESLLTLSGMGHIPVRVPAAKLMSFNFTGQTV